MFRTKLLVISLMAGLATLAVACGSDRPAAGPTSTATSETPTPTPATGGGPTPIAPTPTGATATPTPTQPETQDQLNSARARWAANRPHEYQFSLSRICFCPVLDPTTITVNGNEIVSPGDPVGDGGNGQRKTIDDLFDEIQKALDSADARVLAVEFERDLGYPIGIAIDNIVNAIDDEISYRVTNFRILPRAIDLDQLRADLNAANSRWFESGPQNYEFVFRWECFCPREATAPVRIRVEAGQVVSTVDAATGEPVTALGGLKYQSVSGLFNWIFQRLDRNPEFAELKFDPATGYPISARFNPVLELSDDEEAFFIEEFERLDVHSDVQVELDAASARWDSFATTSYTFQFNWQCFCVQDYIAPVIVTVRDGNVTDVVRVEDDQPVSEQFRDDYVSAEALFGRLQDAIDQDAASIRADFDPVSGLPTNVFIDFQAMLADEELGWNAGSLTALE